MQCLRNVRSDHRYQMLGRTIQNVRSDHVLFTRFDMLGRTIPNVRSEHAMLGRTNYEKKFRNATA